MNVRRPSPDAKTKIRASTRNRECNHGSVRVQSSQKEEPEEPWNLLVRSEWRFLLSRENAAEEGTTRKLEAINI